METITFKLPEDVVKKINAILKPMHFSSRTDFIRESVREKLNAIEKDIIIQQFMLFKGAAKKTITDKELHKIRERIAGEYAKKSGVKLN